jgi:hypothetical protein
MMTHVWLLTLLNIEYSDEALLQKIDDIADAIETGNVIASSDRDVITGLVMTRSGANLLRSVLPDAFA